MGSKLTVLNESPHGHSTEVDNQGSTSMSLTANAVNTRRRHHRREVNSDLLMLGNNHRQRAASTSDAMAASGSAADRVENSSRAANGSGQPRLPGSERQYSLFGHYWDAFLNSDSSSDDDDEESDGAESSSDSDNNRHQSNQRQRGLHSHRSSRSQSNATSNGNVRIPPTNMSTSNALSRASNRRRLRTLIAAHSLPFTLFSASDFKCPICHKTVPSEDIELHVVVCMTKPKIEYNVDVLTEDKGECVICFDDMVNGDKIARLPCLCIYHKRCIDQWFGVRRACPAHPPDDD